MTETAAYPLVVAFNDPSLMPKQLLIMQKLTALLESIPTDNVGGNLAGKVIRGRTVLGQDIVPPFISLLEGNRPDLQPDAAGPENSTQKTIWPILVQGFVADNKSQPTDPAYFLKAACESYLAAILQRNTRGYGVYPELYLLGGLITGMQIGPGVTRPPEANVSANAFFYLPLVIELAIDLNNPYVTVT